jgi:hypothetical protein
VSVGDQRRHADLALHATLQVTVNVLSARVYPHMPVMLSRVFVHGVDLVGGGVVLVGDGAVGDACVDEGHAHGFVA